MTTTTTRLVADIVREARYPVTTRGWAPTGAYGVHGVNDALGALFTLVHQAWY